jgi:demethylspheroidene O-methyltransferase
MENISLNMLPIDKDKYSLLDKILIRKDRLIANRQFQRIVAKVPFLSSISKSRAKGVFDLMAGFVYSQILLACVRVRLFEHLANGPLSLEELSKKVDMPIKGLERLLLGAQSLELIETRGNRFALGILGAPLVGNQALLSMIEHHGALYQDMRDPIALLRGELKEKALESYWPYITEQSEELKSLSDTDKVSQYSALMSDSLPLVADEVIDSYNFNQHQCLLDVGGGQGTFISLLSQRVKHLQFQLFDLPGVAQLAQEKIDETLGAGRVQCFGGDFFNHPIPSGADLVTLIRVIFDHDDARVKQLLRSIYQSLPSGGKLLVAEPMANTEDLPAMGQAYFGFYLLAMGRGRPRSSQEIKDFLIEAGFKRTKLVKNMMKINAQIVVAEK